jgi:hypothetical protein
MREDVGVDLVNSEVAKIRLAVEGGEVAPVAVPVENSVGSLREFQIVVCSEDSLIGRTGGCTEGTEVEA